MGRNKRFYFPFFRISFYKKYVNLCFYYFISFRMTKIDLFSFYLIVKIRGYTTSFIEAVVGIVQKRKKKFHSNKNIRIIRV